jgi:hypothetical protein
MRTHSLGESIFCIAFYFYLVATGEHHPDGVVDVESTKKSPFGAKDLASFKTLANGNFAKHWQAGMHCRRLDLLPVPQLAELFNKKHSGSPPAVEVKMQALDTRAPPETRIKYPTYVIETKAKSNPMTEVTPVGFARAHACEQAQIALPMFFCRASLSVAAPLPSPIGLDKTEQKRVFVRAYESIVSDTSGHRKVTKSSRNKAGEGKKQPAVAAAAAATPSRKDKGKGDETAGAGSADAIPLGRKAKGKPKRKAEAAKPRKRKGKSKPEDDVEAAYKDDPASGSETESDAEEPEADMEDVLNELRDAMDTTAEGKTKRGRPSNKALVAAAPAKIEQLWQPQRKSELPNPAKLPYMLSGAKYYAPVYRYLKREFWDLFVQL